MTWDYDTWYWETFKKGHDCIGYITEISPDGSFGVVSCHIDGQKKVPDLLSFKGEQIRGDRPAVGEKVNVKLFKNCSWWRVGYLEKI